MTYPPSMAAEKSDKSVLLELLATTQNGDRKALARLITLAENQPEDFEEINLDSNSTSHILGITGAPGVGKSTTVNALISFLRKEEKSIAVIAVDPSSPISGGALLGDRIRLTEHFLDPKVFIRSLATRGHLGGLSASTALTIKLAALSGFDYIIVETVGVGQSEVEIMRHAQTVVVVMAPGMGDGIQASKAGILEIGDIYLVNKSDRDGAKETAKELEKSLHLSPRRGKWQPVILLGAMEKQVGIEELVKTISDHREAL